MVPCQSVRVRGGYIPHERTSEYSAILRNSTFGQKLHLKVNFRTICLQMCNFCCNFATDFGIEACYLPIS